MALGRRAAAGVLAAALVVVAACSDGGGDEADAASTTTATSRPDDGPVSGGVLRLGIATVPSLDPATISPDSPSASIVADLLFDGLTTLLPGAAAAEPALAARWNTTDSARTWRFVLRRDAEFSDGTAVTAADAEFALERVVSQGPASLTASRLDAISGFVDFVAAGGRDAGADLAGIRAVDTSTLEIVLDRPLASLPELLGAPTYGIVSQAGVEDDGADFASGPSVTSGSFHFARRRGDVLSLTRASGRGTHLDGVELHQHDDLTDAYRTFEAGDLDWTLVPPSAVDDAAEQFGTDGFVPFQAELFFGFNLADPRFVDVRFRQAMVHAVDREAIVDAVYPGVADPLDGIIPAGVRGGGVAGCAAGCDHDPAAAEALLAQALPAGGIPEVNLDFAEGTDEAAVAAILEQNLEAVGIPVMLRPHPAADYPTFAVSGAQGFVGLGWIGVQATPEDYVDRLFRTGSADNLTGFSDPTVDGLLDQAAATLDPSTRVRLVAQAEAAVVALAPTLPIAQFRVLSVMSERVHDLELSVTGTFDAESVWLEP